MNKRRDVCTSSCLSHDAELCSKTIVISTVCYCYDTQFLMYVDVLHIASAEGGSLST